MSIFDHLNFDDLLHLAEINQHFHDLIFQHYLKIRFHQSVVRFDTYGSKEERNPNEIVLSNYDIILQTLRRFGSFIKKLIFSGDTFEFDQIAEISHHIAEYSAQSLIEITLVNVDNYLLSTTNQIFHRVKTVKIRCASFIDNFRLNHIYPMMKTLKFTLNTPSRVLLSLRRQYEHLENVAFYETVSTGENINFRPVFELNPQIRSLELPRFPSHDLLQVINDSLPNLESLSVSCYPLNYLHSYENGQNVHLINVKRFTISLPWQSPETLDHFPITFENLESLEVASSRLFDVPVRLIEQNEHLKVLSLATLNVTPNFANILNVIKRLTELEAITLQWTEAVAQSELWRLMNKVGKLRNVTFIIEQSSDFNKLIVPDEWKLLKVEDILRKKHVTFECLKNTGRN